MKRKINFSLLFIMLVGLDWYLKQQVSQKMALHQSIDVIPNWLSLTYVHNYGAAFGIMESQRWLLIIITLVIFGLVIIKRRKLSEQSTTVKSGILLILAGACGNLLDRGIFGYVIDYIDLHYKDIYHWPVFNLADIIICIGMIVLVIRTFLDEKAVSVSALDTSNMSVNDNSDDVETEIGSVGEDKQQ